MLQRRSLSNNINNIFLFFVMILLSGIIVMTVGFVNNNSFIIYLGVFITGATSFSLIFQVIISNGSGNVFYRLHRKR